MKNRFFKLIVVLFIASSILVSTAFAFPLDVSAKTSTRIAPGSTILRQAGGLPRAAASSWHLGTCTSQTQKDWVVTYKFADAKNKWREASASQVRFYASTSSLIKWYPGLNMAYVKAANASGVTLCISSGNGLIKTEDVKDTWIWLVP